MLIFRKNKQTNVKEGTRQRKSKQTEKRTIPRISFIHKESKALRLIARYNKISAREREERPSKWRGDSIKLQS